MEFQLGAYMAIATVMFGLGAIGFLVRRNLLIQLMCIEVMLNSVNVLLVAFNRYMPDNQQGQVFAFFVIAIAAAEASLGLAIVIALFRLRNTVETDQADALRH